MDNSQLNSTLLTMEISRQLTNKIGIASHFDGRYNKEYMKEYAVGDTIYPRLPWRVIKKQGIGLQLQPLVDRVSSITMDQFFQYSVDFNSIEQALTLPRPTAELRRQIAEPVADQLAQDIDSAAALWVLQNSSNVVGQLGTAITDLSVLRSAKQKLVELAGWKNGMTGVLTPGGSNQVVGLGQAIFNKQSTLANQFATMQVGEYADVNWQESMSLYSQTAGTAVTSITVTGANQAGNAIILTGTAGQTFKQGDKIAFGSGSTGCYAVNPSTRRSTLALRVFTVTVDFTLTAGPDTIPIIPSIIGPGSQYQNVDALPQDGAAVVLWPGTTSPSGKQGAVMALFAPDAFAIVGAKLYEPKSCEYHSVSPAIPGTPISVRMTTTWDEVLSRLIVRFDCLFGFGNVEPENKSVLIAGSV